MAFRDFTFPEVQRTLGLTMRQAHLYDDVAPLTLSAELLDRIREGVDLARATNTEKARSEFTIAPVLFEVRRMLKNAVSLFSGVEFNVDPQRGLNGYCDFIMTRSTMNFVVTAPVVAIAEAKNDNVNNGLGQCIAAMVAAREFNKAEQPGITIHGVVTTGSLWGFLRLDGNDLTLDPREHSYSELGRIMAILVHILKTA